jgi:hypothetical protein
MIRSLSSNNSHNHNLGIAQSLKVDRKNDVDVNANATSEATISKKISSSNAYRSNSIVRASRVQKVFLLCILLVTASVYYGNVETSKLHGSNLLLSREYKSDESNAVILGWISPITNNDSGVPETNSMKTENSKEKPGLITDLSRNSISMFIRKETETMLSRISSIKNTSMLDPINNCGNSERWLKGSRYGNLNDDPFLSHDLVQHLIFSLQNVLSVEEGSVMPAILGQTICHQDSRFLNHSLPLEQSYDSRTKRVWAVKLIYMAMHYHQHRLAIPEALARYRNETKATPACPTLKQLE